MTGCQLYASHTPSISSARSPENEEWKLESMNVNRKIASFSLEAFEKSTEDIRCYGVFKIYDMTKPSATFLMRLSMKHPYLYGVRESSN